ncbi:hypothetical protein [Marinobacter sp. SS21]|uniref:hypothetical protein n=1 Tax=Marinobacter sp. SS21 TaxID=2979460 RepID=UPI00232EB2BD|nr:hypothetical protein [Marinobacter sp. SS21]MDC0664370.1 hypothetical protein [Marinobacter sp. SS21]
MDLTTVRHTVELDWEPGSPVGAACLAVAEYVFTTSGVTHLTFGRLRGLISGNGVELSERDLVSVAGYLCRDDLKILKVGFEFIDENDEIFPLSQTDVNEANRAEIFPHPITGEPVPEFKEQIFMFFEPGV